MRHQRRRSPGDRRSLPPTAPLTVALATLCLTAAACGGGSTGPSGVVGEVPTNESGAVADEDVPTGDGPSTRTGTGVAAVGGNPPTEEGNPCELPAGAGGESLEIAYVGADLEELEAIGLESIVLDDPSIVIDAYVTELNATGGINGRCVEFTAHLWSLRYPDASSEQICTELSQEQPLAVLSLSINEAILECVTLDAGVPTMGIQTTKPNARFAAADGRLFADQGSETYLMAAAVDIALQAGELTLNDRVGILNLGEWTARFAIEQSGLTIAEWASAPPEFRDTAILAIEKQAQLLEDGLSETERQAALSYRQQLPAEQAQLLESIEQQFLDSVAKFREAGVTIVIAGGGWADVRRLMRAAELQSWYPKWIINDSQPASRVLTDAPRAQAANLLQVSANRAAGDAIPEMDRGCLTLRNTSPQGGRFSHRFHTAAWNTLTSVCDYLDVFFGAVSRINGPVTQDALTESLAATDYETDFGSLIKFGSKDHFGNDRFRVLAADPACVLNSWGCMRATSDWLTPS